MTGVSRRTPVLVLSVPVVPRPTAAPEVVGIAGRTRFRARAASSADGRTVPRSGPPPTTPCVSRAVRTGQSRAEAERTRSRSPGPGSVVARGGRPEGAGRAAAPRPRRRRPPGPAPLDDGERVAVGWSGAACRDPIAVAAVLRSAAGPSIPAGYGSITTPTPIGLRRVRTVRPADPCSWGPEGPSVPRWTSVRRHGSSSPIGVA